MRAIGRVLPEQSLRSFRDLQEEYSGDGASLSPPADKAFAASMDVLSRSGRRGRCQGVSRG